MSLRPKLIKSHDEESPETVRAKFRSISKEPTQDEINEHNIDHAQFRSWCPHCVKGKAIAFPHLRTRIKQHDVPIISIDYAFMNDDGEQKDDKDEGMPI